MYLHERAQHADMNIPEDNTMRPFLFFIIRKAKKYKKEHNLPDTRTLTDEMLEKRRKLNADPDYYDCFSLDEKAREGVDLKKIPLPNCQAWMISTSANPSDKILYYIHGGGFWEGSTKQGFRFVSYVAKHWGYNVFSVDYRLCPQYKCADTLSDCQAGYEHLLKTFAPKHIILMGESAGGNMVFALSHRLRANGLPFPGGIISCSPVLQFLHYPYSYYECANKTDYGIIFGINEIIEHYRGDLPIDSPYVSPLLGDLTGFPPVYLDASSCESLRDEARMMYVLLKEKNIDVEYHELRDFLHALVLAPQLRFVRREEHPLIQSFIKKVFAE